MDKNQGTEDPKARSRLATEQWVGATAMAVLVVITLANVVTRYLTNRSFAWTEEISVFLLVVLTLAGAAWAAHRDSHIRIDFVYLSGGDRRRRLLRRLTRLSTSCLFLLLALLSARAALGEYQLGETTPGLGIPRWWYTAWLPPLALWVAVRAWRAKDGLTSSANFSGEAP